MTSSPSEYERLEREQERSQKIRDWSAKWERLQPLAGLNEELGGRLRRFCEAKRIRAEALMALDARIAPGKNGAVSLAFAGRGPTGAVTAIKYRPLDAGSHETRAEQPSVWLCPIVAGARDALEWFVAEGETDAARLLDLAPEGAAVLCLPAGARTFKRAWADQIPRGATVYLAHDGDEEGDAGAAKAAALLGGTTVRLRPPAKDWCEWEGEREAFVELVRAAKSNSTRAYEFVRLVDFLEHKFPKPEPLLGRPGQVFLAIGSFLLVFGSDGSGKSTWTVDGIAHLAAGEDWLGLEVPRTVRFCVIENEGPPGLFQQKLAEKLASWQGPPWQRNVFPYKGPWGEFSFADGDARAALREFCEQHAIDVVVANPTLGLGVAGSGRPDETQQFVDWLVECGLKTTRAFWLLHHENKAGQISGDWGRHPDTKVLLQADGDQPRTKLTWSKTRWAVTGTEEQPKACLLEWVVETKGYEVRELSAGVSDDELATRIDAFLAEHPRASTKAVREGVKGADARIRELLKSGRYNVGAGPHGANLYSLSSDVGLDVGAQVIELPGIPHE
jgi:hypothetical protein